jgi:hypothetical protein
MAAAVIGWLQLAPSGPLAALGGIAIGGVVYALCAIVLRMELWGFVRRGQQS